LPPQDRPELLKALAPGFAACGWLVFRISLL
jgi:hypothetical protein